MEFMLEPCKQALIAYSSHWEDVTGRMFMCQKKEKWESVGDPIDVTFGELGLIPADLKREGDKKSPAGIFKLGPLFTQYPPETGKKSLFDLKFIEKDLEAIDDPNSLYYNQIVRRSDVSKPDWQSSEPMHFIELYSFALFIQHNWPNPRFSKGSALFIHRWSTSDKGTFGCTAMNGENLDKIVEWLDPKSEPVLVQGTKEFIKKVLKIDIY